LKSNESRSIEFKANFPCAEIPSSIEILVSSQNQVISKKLPVKIVSDADCYSLSMTLPQTLLVKPAESAKTEASIFNSGKESQVIKLKSISLPWVFVQPKEFELAANASKQIFVYASPEYNLKKGVYPVLISFISNQNALVEKQISINVSDSVSVDENISSKGSLEIIKVLLDNSTQKIKVDLLVKNNFNEPVSISNIALGENFSLTDFNAVSIDSNSTKQILFSLTQNNFVSGNQLIPIVLDSSQGIFKKELSLDFKNGFNATGFISLNSFSIGGIFIFLIIVAIIAFFVSRTYFDKKEVNDYLKKFD